MNNIQESSSDVAVSNQGEKTSRLVSPTKVAELKRKMDGAERRKDRLELELVDCRAIIRRKYTDRRASEGHVVGRNQLSPEQVFGFKLTRTKIEKELAIARRDYFTTCKAYRFAVTNNFLAERKALKDIRHENRIIIQSKKLLQETREMLKKHGSNGGAKEVKMLTDLAVSGDKKTFRETFGETVKKFDPLHYAEISGVCTVETEIINRVMDELARLGSTTEDGFNLDVVTQ